MNKSRNHCEQNKKEKGAHTVCVYLHEILEQGKLTCDEGRD